MNPWGHFLHFFEINSKFHNSKILNHNFEIAVKIFSRSERISKYLLSFFINFTIGPASNFEGTEVEPVLLTRLTVYIF